ncbi:MAG: DUF4215 domain-containing protein, partial [archaeon]
AETTSFGAGDANIWVFKTDELGKTCTFDAAGNCLDKSDPNKIRFVKNLGTAGAESVYSAYEIKKLNNEGYVLTGYTTNSSGNIDLLLMKIDEYGNGPAGYGSCGVCGNGIAELAAGEECDDGNSDPNDLCNACKLTFCGDQATQLPDGKGIFEACDDGMHCSNGAQCSVSSDCGAGTDGVCKPRSGGGCDEWCIEQLLGLKITSVVFSPDKIKADENPSQFQVVVDSVEFGPATIDVSVNDAVTGKTMQSFAPLATYNLVAGSQAIDLGSLVDFSQMGLKEGGSYKAVVKIVLVSNTSLNDFGSAFFTVSSQQSDTTAVAVPDFNLLLLPVLLAGALGVLAGSKRTA